MIVNKNELNDADMSDFFQQYRRSDIDGFVRKRPGETKLGELVAVAADENVDEFLKNTRAFFIVIGIAEDIGVVANRGRAGASETWTLFLSSFLNMQANSFTKATMIAVLGHFSFDKIKSEIEKKTVSADEKINDYRNAVNIIDDAVAELIRLIVAHQKFPIVVGGGHNNAYPLLKGTALALGFSRGINCINLDAHLDYRTTEGRHSGNGFRYAKEHGYLNRYFAVGVHESYLNESIVEEIRHRHDMDFISYEKIFVRKKITWPKALKAAVKFAGQRMTGIELDLDSISKVPASAIAPCGVTAREALQYVNYLPAHANAAYLHVCEGIASSENSVGKLISYLVIQCVSSYPLERRLRKGVKNDRGH